VFLNASVVIKPDDQCRGRCFPKLVNALVVP
jgi:hypothetical protein